MNREGFDLRWRVAIVALAAAGAVVVARARPQGEAPAADAAGDVRRALEPIARLDGEPASVSAAGVTRAETPLVTIENPGAFDPSAARRRLVIVGGLQGDRASARAVVDAVRWFKAAAPARVRLGWTVSALPLAAPDGHAAPFAFPPAGGYFDAAEQPESRYLWRWVTFQAPDLVVIVRGREDASADALAAALADPKAAGLGSVTAKVLAPDGLAGTLNAALELADLQPRPSPLHAALARRVTREPADIARSLAARYPQRVTMSYIPAVAWINTLRLARLIDDRVLRDKVLGEIEPWLSGARPPLGAEHPLTSIAGVQVFGELRDPRARALLLEGARLAGETHGDVYANGRGWTDDMFMATAVLARAGRLDAAARMLVAYAARLQRPDGLFVHAPDAPVAWGRGNGFAAFGLMEALTAMPASHPLRAPLLDIYRRHMAAVRAEQAPDGAWRQILDRPGSYREETATAMLQTAMARGIRRGWLDRSYRPVVDRAWRALAAHIGDEGDLVDVCTGTGAGPTARDYYDRKAIDGRDDRGAAMALFATVEGQLRR